MQEALGKCVWNNLGVWFYFLNWKFCDQVFLMRVQSEICCTSNDKLPTRF